LSGVEAAPAAANANDKRRRKPALPDNSLTDFTI
jgi:hypothetical protein